MTSFGENVQNPQFFTLNPQIKIFFQNSGYVTFFSLLTPNFMQSFRNYYWTVSEIFKDRQTDQQATDKPPIRAIIKDHIG